VCVCVCVCVFVCVCVCVRVCVCVSVCVLFQGVVHAYAKCDSLEHSSAPPHLNTHTSVYDASLSHYHPSREKG